MFGICGRRQRLGHLEEVLAHDLVRNRIVGSHQLERLALGERVVPQLEAALQSTTAPEARFRLQQILQDLADARVTAFLLRRIRAITILARVDTPASRRLLADIARGPASDQATIAAKAVLAQTGQTGASAEGQSGRGRDR